MNSQPESSAVPTASNFYGGEIIRRAACGQRAPETFSPDWHPQLGEGLSGFPRFVPFRFQENDSQDEIICWPDFATFVEEPDSRQMMYYPAEESALSLRVICNAQNEDGRWRLFAYLDADLLSMVE